MPLLQRLPSGLLLALGGKLMTDCCCDCTGNTTTADFSYSQTGSDPCVIDLFDESTADAGCGAISAWWWYVNGVLVSTERFPTGIEVEDGDEVTLVVRDECGCTDSATMPIDCEDLTLCANCAVPDTISATLPAIKARDVAGAQCDNCVNLSGQTFSLPTETACNWRYNQVSGVLACTVSGGDIVETGANWTVDIQVHLTYDAGDGKWDIDAQAEFYVAGVSNPTTLTFALHDQTRCRGAFSLAFVSEGTAFPNRWCSYDSGTLDVVI